MPAPAQSIATLLAHGCTIRVGRGETPTWSAITGLQNVEFPDQMPADLDITNQASPGLAEENAPGLLPAVDYSIDHILDVGSDGDTALTALNARDATTGEKELHLLEVKVGSGANAMTGTWVVYLKDYRPVGSLKGNVMMRTTWRVMAQVLA